MTVDSFFHQSNTIVILNEMKNLNTSTLCFQILH